MLPNSTLTALQPRQLGPSRRTGMGWHVLLHGVLPYGVGVFSCWILVNRLETGRWLGSPGRLALQLGVSLAGGFVVGFARWMATRRRRILAP
jgi:hypothetical protein